MTGERKYTVTANETTHVFNRHDVRVLGYGYLLLRGDHEDALLGPDGFQIIKLIRLYIWWETGFTMLIKKDGEYELITSHPAQTTFAPMKPAGKPAPLHNEVKLDPVWTEIAEVICTGVPLAEAERIVREAHLARAGGTCNSHHELVLVG